MINAFGLCRSLATAHEDLIGFEILKHEKQANRSQPRNRNVVRNHDTKSCQGTTANRRAAMDRKWLDRAKKLREFLAHHPGASMVEIMDGLGEGKNTTQAWLFKMRANPQYGIAYLKGIRAINQYSYWLAKYKD